MNANYLDILAYLVFSRKSGEKIDGVNYTRNWSKDRDCTLMVHHSLSHLIKGYDSFHFEPNVVHQHIEDYFKINTDFLNQKLNDFLPFFNKKRMINKALIKSTSKGIYFYSIELTNAEFPIIFSEFKIRKDKAIFEVRLDYRYRITSIIPPAQHSYAPIQRTN